MTAHGDRLSGTDAAFLEMEAPNQPMHVGGLVLLDGTGADGFSFARFAQLVRSRLHLIPRYRQRLAFTPFNLANPVWVDDVDFDLSYHLRHAALPRPGTIAQLMDFGGRVLSRPLDRDRPLWEMYVVEGLDHGRVAIIGKSHHALVDGVAGMDLLSLLLDADPDASTTIPAPQPWTPQPPPAGHELAWSGIVEALASPVEVLAAGRRLLSRPQRMVRDVAEVGRGLVSVARSGLARPAPRSLLNAVPGRHRRFAIQRLSLDDVRFVKSTFGTTVNDVLLALVADATGRFLRYRGARTDGLTLRAMVPVSTRAPGQGETPAGNAIVSVFVDLPMGEMDPVERLRRCADEMGEVKSSHRAAGARFIIDLAEFAPPVLHAAASRLASSGRLFNFLVTNVPGPQVPLYSLGARVLGAFPFVPLANFNAYAVGVTSLDGWMNVGITADWDTLPDVEVVTGYLREALDELVRHAEAVDARGEIARRPTPGPDEHAPITPAAGGGPSGGGARERTREAG